MRDKYDDFLCGGHVSIWVGNFTDEDSLDDYINEHFPEDFGFVVSPRAACEIAAKPEPVEILELVDGFSRSKSFGTAAVKAAADKGITKASSMFVMYNFRYPESEIRNRNAMLQFIGTFPFSGFS